jgi:steroid 5-alpha reductase family enzyme
MSLKAFHLVFVSASVLLMLGLTAWCLGNYRRSDSSMDLVWSAAALASAAALLVYGRFFLRKLKHISYL